MLKFGLRFFFTLHLRYLQTYNKINDFIEYRVDQALRNIVWHWNSMIT